MAERYRVLVTDAEERAVLATCRALASAGHLVSTTASSRPAASALSRSVSACFDVRDPRAQDEDYVGSLVEVLRGVPHDVLIPGAEASLRRTRISDM